MKKEKVSDSGADTKGQAEPEKIFDLPPVTKMMLVVLLGTHIILTFFVPDDLRFALYQTFGFRPASYTVEFPGWPAVVAPFSYMFFHGSTYHFVMNFIMLLVLGGGVERWLGGGRLLFFFVACNIGAAVFHFALFPFSPGILIGASGGSCGLFAPAMIMLRQKGRIITGRYGFWPLIALWILIALLFGQFSNPDGSMTAWAAHIGGFLTGLLLVKPALKGRAS